MGLYTYSYICYHSKTITLIIHLWLKFYAQKVGQATAHFFIVITEMIVQHGMKIKRLTKTKQVFTQCGSKTYGRCSCWKFTQAHLGRKRDGAEPLRPSDAILVTFCWRTSPSESAQGRRGVLLFSKRLRTWLAGPTLTKAIITTRTLKLQWT